jgi:hypothetical protein
VNKEFSEICANCRCTRGSHLFAAYTNEFYGRSFPRNYCLGHEGRMDWDANLAETTFMPSGTYKHGVNKP